MHLIGLEDEGFWRIVNMQESVAREACQDCSYRGKGL